MWQTIWMKILTMQFPLGVKKVDSWKRETRDLDTQQAEVRGLVLRNLLMRAAHSTGHPL